VKADRLNPYNAAPAAVKPLMELDRYLKGCGLENALIELVKMRASQINGCAFCLDLHSKDAREAGETEQRLYLLSGWREARVYSERERAALSWTEALTNISSVHVSDAIFDEVREHFSDKEIADLTSLIGLINSFNRIAISLRYQHG